MAKGKDAKRAAKGEPASKKPRMTKEERRKKYVEIARNRRRKQQDQNRKKQVTCYHCRQQGHLVAECPSKPNTDVEDTAICYKCGSTEHSLSHCPKRNDGKPTDLPYASCFLCKKKGHLISKCPENTKGIFVNGGECRKCGSKEHVASQCTETKSTKDKKPIQDDQEEVDELLEAESPHPVKKSPTKDISTARKPRVVNF